MEDERRVVEVASLPVAARGFNGLEDPPVEADGGPARAERDPEQVNAPSRGRLHGRLGGSSSSRGVVGRAPVVRRRSADDRGRCSGQAWSGSSPSTETGSGSRITGSSPSRSSTAGATRTRNFGATK